jgi:hypothetical protein
MPENRHKFAEDVASRKEGNDGAFDWQEVL